MMEALVVVVDGDRQHLLRMILTNHVIVENLADFLRRWYPVPGFAQSGLGILAADIRAQLNAFIADEHRRPGDELADLMLALSAERAVERILRIAARDLAHSCRRGATFSVPGVVAVVRSCASKCVSSRQSA